jgi:hypothetical protein
LLVWPGVATASSVQPSPRQRLAIGQHAVGLIVGVERRVGARAAVVERQRRATDDRRPVSAASGREAGLWSRWVWVQTIAATRAFHGRHDRLDMALRAGVGMVWGARPVRARIDHRHIRPFRPDRSACR